MSIPRLPVSSSSIASIGYSTDATLDVEFQRGVVYRYFAVPKDVYDALMLAGAKGTYFNRHVRPHFRYERMKEAEFTQHAA
jgi:hypothetical protein